jgi:hypothetical protein
MHTGIPIANEHQALIGHEQVSGLRVKRDVGRGSISFFGVGGTQYAISFGAN